MNYSITDALKLGNKDLRRALAAASDHLDVINDPQYDGREWASEDEREGARRQVAILQEELETRRVLGIRDSRTANKFIVTDGDQVYCEDCYEEQFEDNDPASYAFDTLELGECERCGLMVKEQKENL